MACFIVPMTRAVVTTVMRKRLKKEIGSLKRKFTTVIFALIVTISASAQNVSFKAENTPITTSKADSKVCIAIRNYLLGRKKAAILTKTAKKDIYESSWPEVQCSVEGTLDSPGAFKNLTVRKVAKNRYKYECTCPLHGDKFVDFCTMTATLGKDGKVRITHVSWDK